MDRKRTLNKRENGDRGGQPKIAVFVSFSGMGGVERMILNLCEGLVTHGCRLDLLPVKSPGCQLFDHLPDALCVRQLMANHTLTSLPALIHYLKTERPDALLAAKDRANQIAIIARAIAGVPTRIVVRMGTTVSAALAGKNQLKKMAWYLPMRFLYPKADAIIAVSHGVARDMSRITGVDRAAMHVVRNPVISNHVFAKAREPVSHAWLQGKGEPVILGIGRLTRQKDFPTLIQAFAGVRQHLACRLIILGEGKDRRALEMLAKKLSVAAFVDMPGYVDNPYAYLSRASMFVLSSAWEGSPNVLTEALALGVPSVATDCPSGPREILRDGVVGKLVPVGNPEILAEAMRVTLFDPPDKALLKSAVREYTVESSSKRYLEILLNRGQGQLAICDAQ
jgi:glycosyltransferase involved in cell wall biosynthesis